MTFELEKKACGYCEQYGISERSPLRDAVINAFCVSAKIERKECKEQIIAKLLEIGALGEGEYIAAIRAL